jgi:hypothetical protein
VLEKVRRTDHTVREINDAINGLRVDCMYLRSAESLPVFDMKGYRPAEWGPLLRTSMCNLFENLLQFLCAELGSFDGSKADHAEAKLCDDTGTAKNKSS